MMGIVHGALRRDLLRTHDALTAEPYPQGRQRQALGEHVVWMMEFLHAHHTGEDEGLWPLVRRQNPAAGALLDSLEADHLAISPAAAALAAAGGGTRPRRPMSRAQARWQPGVQAERPERAAAR
jgi:hypothetical protein